MGCRALTLCFLLGGGLALGCAKPVLTRDGTLVFQEPGARGAAVLTANGIEFHDGEDVPERVVVRDAYEPWRAPIGFILPASGRFTETSQPTVLASSGLEVSLRPSDTRVPSWGGEVLVRVDIAAPAAAGPARAGEDVVVIVDLRGTDAHALAEAALNRLSGRNRVTVLDDAGEVVVPAMPASNRSMALAAIEKRIAEAQLSRARADPPRAIAHARAALAGRGAGRVLLIGRSGGAAKKAVAELARAGLPFAEVAADARGGALDERLRAIREAVPAGGALWFGDVALTFEGTPAPSHVLEASGGDVRWELDAGELALGDIRAGDVRTEVVRVTVPAWTPGERFSFSVTARFSDLTRGGEERTVSAHIPCLYDDDIARIAESRNGDVIAYASALATLKRLDAAFVGPGIDRAGGLATVARLHAESMAHLARDMKDPSALEQAEILQALLAATR